jgi:hypothetical protein
MSVCCGLVIRRITVLLFEYPFACTIFRVIYTDNPTYQSSISYITSGDVTACTLVLSGLNVSANQGSVQLETIFTVGASVQYQLTTVIRLSRARLVSQETLDNAEWMTVPAPLVRHGPRLDLTCKVSLVFTLDNRTISLRRIKDTYQNRDMDMDIVMER